MTTMEMIPSTNAAMRAGLAQRPHRSRSGAGSHARQQREHAESWQKEPDAIMARRVRQRS